MVDREKTIALVRGVQQGRDGAATELYQTFYSDIYYFILKNANNDAELAADLTQDTFMEILQTIQNLQEPAAFPKWSHQIAYHRCTAYFRKRRDLLADEDEDGYSVFDTIEEEREEFIPGEALEKEELKKIIFNMLQQLPEEQRSALILRYFNEMSVKDIADIQGVSEGTVKSRLNYGRKTMKQAVESYEKRSGVKLHCAGVIPLLLWLFREYRLSKNISLTAQYSAGALKSKAASATGKIAGKVTTSARGTGGIKGAGEEGVKRAAKDIGKSSAKTVAKKATKSLATKIIAGVTAAALVTGGAMAAPKIIENIQESSSSRQSQQHKQEKEQEKEKDQEKNALTWTGYGEVINVWHLYRFDMSVYEMDEDTISGHLVVSYNDEIYHESDFTGEGANENRIIRYEIEFETIHYDDEGFDTSFTDLLYNSETEQMIMTDVYEVIMVRGEIDSQEILLAKDAAWAGTGRCYYCLYNYGHVIEDDSDIENQFELEIYEASEHFISGKLTVSKDGVVEYVSEFNGLSNNMWNLLIDYENNVHLGGSPTQDNGDFYYHIYMETPISTTHQYFMHTLYYNNDVFEMRPYTDCLYVVEMSRESEK